MSELQTKTVTRSKLVDNSMETGGETKLGIGKYMRHIPSGRVYPYEENGAKRDDVEVFMHGPKGDTKINKPPKAKPQGPFARAKQTGNFGQTDRILDVTPE
jgi:hypothetical protein